MIVKIPLIDVFRRPIVRPWSKEGINILLSLSIMFFSWTGDLEAARQLPADLTELSLEELMDITVTSVAKKEQRLSHAAAAIFVITRDEIRRSGVTSIPEALRMAPGLQVARIGSNNWAITSRGFNGRFASKLLVLMDGRSVYTPLYSGVFWDVQDTILEDVERIEVIRGPGAALWGANAVNGVINIITKKAEDTQGSLVFGGLGTEERRFGGARYGGKLGNDAYYRIFAKYFDRDGSVDASNNHTPDDWDVLRGGFRVDWMLSGSNDLTLQGDIYDGDVIETGQITSLSAPYTWISDEDTDLAGGDISAHLKHTFSGSSDLDLQVYYDRTERTNRIVAEVRDTFDMDFQHRFPIDGWNEVIWGLGYRFTSDDIGDSFTISLEPSSRDDQLFSAFVQDDITLVEDRLRLMVGSKFEHNDYTGFEVQPDARLLWTPRENHSVWAAVSRAVRTPNRTENDIRVNSLVLPPGSLVPVFPGTGMVSIFGTHSFESEELLAFELGYRTRPVDRLSLDAAAFYNVYDELRTAEFATQFLETSEGQVYLVMPLTGDNKMSGKTYGVELAVGLQALNWWRVQAAYTYLQMLLDLDGDSADPSSEDAEGGSPHNQFSFRSTMDLWNNLEFDLWVRWVDELPIQNVDSYFSLDVRLGWTLLEHIELSIVGQNLLDRRHIEFKQELYNTDITEVERSVYGKILWRF